MTFFDIGSNDGFYALVFAKSQTSAGVIAVEPWDEARKWLHVNCWLNDLEDEDGCAIRIVQSFIGEGSSAPNGRPFVPLGSLFTDKDVGPALIKIDIDGGEIEAVRSAFPLPAGLEAYFVIETHSAHLENACLDLLKARGFQVKIIKNAWWRLFCPEERPIAHNRWMVAWNTGEPAQAIIGKRS